MSVLSCVLTKLVEKNDENFMHCASSRFHSLVPSTVPIYDYLMRYLVLTFCSIEFVVYKVHLFYFILNFADFTQNIKVLGVLW